MSEVAKKYVLTYEADVKSYVDGVEKISVTTRRMAVNSKQDAASVEKAVSQAGLKNVRVYEESATTLARTVKSQLASNKKLASSHKSTSSQIVAANDSVYRSTLRNNRGNRAVMQSAGYQLQDVMVQAQQNTNAWMILSQQGSQFASSFGAGGAVAGALISIVGMLGMVATSGGEAADALEDVEENFNSMSRAAKELAAGEATNRLADETKTLDQMKATLKNATAEYDKLIKVRKSGAFGELRTGDLDGSSEAKALNEITVAMERQEEVVKDLTYKTKLLNGEISTRDQALDDDAEFAGAIGKLKKENDKKKSVIAEMTKAMERQTRSIEQEYNYRKGLIDSASLTEEEAARYYGALEKWKTAELKKESDKRDKIAQAIIDSNIQAAIRGERRRKRALESDVDQVESLIPPPNYDEYEAEMARHLEFEQSYNEAYAKTSKWDLGERTRLNNAKEAEKARHIETMQKMAKEASKNQINSTIASGEQLASTMLNAASETSGAYKALFLMQQGLAISMGTMRAFSSAEMARTTAANATRMSMAGAPSAEAMAQAAGASAYAFDLSLGLANVGATAGVAFAGAFDKGGYIPNNSAGIVSEYGDELVGGTLVYNQSGSPLGVTGREKTADMMKSGNSESNKAQMSVNQNFYINGNPDKTALAEMKRMANNGRDEAYAMVARDFKTDRGISKSSARRR